MRIRSFLCRDVFHLQGYILHYGSFGQNGTLSNASVTCRIDNERRANLSRNHTTTHLVNKVLRELLHDTNLIQKASLVHEDYFMFEYSSVTTDNTATVFQQLEKRVSGVLSASRRDTQERCDHL